jgi:hypothetical protein
MKINGNPLKAYVDAVREELGEEWIKAADSVVVGHETVGYVARQHTMACFMRGTKVATCADQIRKKFT